MYDNEEEEKKRLQDIENLFGTNSANSNIQENDTYSKRIQNVQDLFGIRDYQTSNSNMSNTDGTKILYQPTIVNNNEPSDILKKSSELIDETANKTNTIKKSRDIVSNARNKKTTEIKNNAIKNSSSIASQARNKKKSEPETVGGVSKEKLIADIRKQNEPNENLAEKALALTGTVVLGNTFGQDSSAAAEQLTGVLGNIGEGIADFVPSSVDFINSLEKNSIRKGVRKAYKMLGYSEAEIERLTQEAMDGFDQYSILSNLNNLMNNEYKESLRAERIEKNNALASGNFLSELLAEVAPSIGSNTVSMALTAVNPVLGTASFIMSAGGSYLDDAEARGMNEDQAIAYATVMGSFEGITESLITGSMVDKIGRKVVGKGLSEKVLKSWGVSAAENFMQEAIMEPLQEATATVTGGADKANWDNMGNRMLEAGISGVVSSVILGGASMGIASAENVVKKRNPTVDDYAQAFADTVNSGKIDVKGIVQGAQEAIIVNGGTQQFYTTTLNQDGNVESVQAVRGKPIENPNSKVNISPAIIKNSNDMYNVIDSTTGILIDSTPYTTLIEAQTGFTDKMNSLDNATINNINNQVAKASMAVYEKTQELTVNRIMSNNSQVQEDTQVSQENVTDTIKSSTNNVNVNLNDINPVAENNNNQITDTAQTSENQFRGNYSSNETNYTSDNGQNATGQNNSLSDVSKLMSQISYNSIYNRKASKAILNNVSRNIPNIEVQETNGKIYLNSLNEYGDIAYQQQIPGRPLRGIEIREIVNNAINNADLSNIQTNENGFRGDYNEEATNYMSENEKASNLSDEEIRNIVKYNQDGREISDKDYVNFLVKRYKDNKNISGIITDTKYVESIENKTKKDKISDLYKKIQDKEFKIAKKLRSKNGELQNVNIALIITKKGLNESFNKGFSNEKYAVVPYLDELIKTAQDGTIRAETKMRSNIMQWYYLYNTAEINGKLYGIKIDIKKTPQGDRFYVHRVNLVHKNGTANQIPAVGNGTIKTNAVPSEGLGALPRQAEVRNFKPAPSINTSIAQNKKSVKNDTNVNNNSMQEKKNNTKNEQKAIQKELHNRIQNAILSKNSRKNTFLGTVSNKVASKIKSLFGIDVSGRNHIISDNDIRHMIKQHGNQTIEASRGQIAITTKDIEKIPDIIAKYDSIEKGSINKDTFTKQDFNTIRYKKQYSDNITYVVEVIPSSSNNLTIKTMWKKKVETNKKNNSSRVNHANNNIDLQNTPEAEPTLSYSSNSITQNKPNVKKSNIRAEKINNTTEYDNQGNKLTKEQQEYFKNSNVRDENGKLKVMWHFTNIGNDFTIFNFNKSGVISSDTQKQLKLMFFSENAGVFEDVIDNMNLIIDENGEYYYNGQNISDYIYGFKTEEFRVGDLKVTPFYINGNILSKINKEQLKEFEAFAKKNYPQFFEHYTVEEIENGYFEPRESEAFVNWVKSKGYDGFALSENTDGNFENVAIFNANQAKKINNISPTSNPDIRYEHKTPNSKTKYNDRPYEQNEDFMNYLNKNEYLKKLMEVDAEQGETNAHTAERLIEQEIRKVDERNGFDNSIPVTKLSDIDKKIEQYLKKKIGKGHFRERAYGIYKKSTDTIRVKEYKDLDNVFHELGHALDLSGRINVNKENLSNELLAAAKRHGGYENESIGIQLDEGFAEIFKTYLVNDNIVKKDYPNSYRAIETIKAQDNSFNDFIEELKQDTYNYIHQSPRNRGGLSNMSIGERTDGPKPTIERIVEEGVKKIWDSNYSIKKMQNEFEKINGRKATPSENAYLLTRLASGVDNKTISMLTKGYVNEDGTRLFPGLGRIGEILGNDPERINDLRAYLAAKHDLEYKAKSLKTGIRTMDSKRIIEQFYNDTQIQEAAQIVYDTLDGVLQYAVNNKLISKETAKTLRETGAFYVPFQRVIEGRGNRVGRRGAVADIINTRTGSELDIKDVLENIITNSANIIKQVENNNVLRAVYEQGQETGMQNNIFEEVSAPMRKVGREQLQTWEAELRKQGVDTSKIDLDKTIDLFVPNNGIVTEKNGSHIVSFFDKDGKRRYLEFYPESTDIFNSLMGMDKNANSTFLKLMRAANMPLRYGATMANVGFAIPNMISDTIQATIYSEAGFVPVVDNIMGIINVLGATNSKARAFLQHIEPSYAARLEQMYDIYQQTGASSSTRMSQYRQSAQELMANVYGVSNSKQLGIDERFVPLKRFMDILTYIPELSESSTRFRVFQKNYEAYLNKGMSEIDARIAAALESRDATQDFGRTGTVMHEVNQLIPFSAARVGSAYTFYEKVKSNPKRVLGRTALLITISMLIKGLGYGDEEIEELNQRKKDDNFVFKIGDTVITLKKPQGILRSIINLSEYIQDLFTGHIEEGKEGNRLVELIQSTIMDNMPADSVTGLVPNAIAPVVENAINKDFYYNTDIVKSYDLDLPEEQQYYDYTSQLAIWLGKVFHYSPAKIDNLISGYFGSLGTQFTNIIDWTSSKLGISVEEPAMGAEDNAIGKRFVVNVNENSASVDEIYSRKDELTKKLNGGTITEEENTELETIKAGISKISALNKQIKAIKQDKEMSGSDKADAIRPLQQLKTDVARQALGKNTIYTTNTDELEALEFYPSRSELSYNGLTLNLTEEMKTEYMNTAYSMYKKYVEQGLYNEEYLEKLKEKIKEAAKKTMIQKYKNQLVK